MPCSIVLDIVFLLKRLLFFSSSEVKLQIIGISPVAPINVDVPITISLLHFGHSIMLSSCFSLFIGASPIYPASIGYFTS